MLVLGEEARRQGLDKSLLERLMIEYEQSQRSKDAHIRLVTNYRCHEDIRKFSGRLFYPSVPLKAPHLRRYQTPLIEFGEYGKLSSMHFVCSEIKEVHTESNANEMEAKAVVDVLTDINRNWPKQHFDKFLRYKVCIMSASRSQVS